MAVSMAALATVCEATARQPEHAQDAMDAAAAESFLASLPLSRTLHRPRLGAPSRCVLAGVRGRPPVQTDSRRAAGAPPCCVSQLGGRAASA